MNKQQQLSVTKISLLDLKLLPRILLFQEISFGGQSELFSLRQVKKKKRIMLVTTTLAEGLQGSWS